LSQNLKKILTCYYNSSIIIRNKKKPEHKKAFPYLNDFKSSIMSLDTKEKTFQIILKKKKKTKYDPYKVLEKKSQSKKSLPY